MFLRVGRSIPEGSFLPYMDHYIHLYYSYQLNYKEGALPRYLMAFPCLFLLSESLVIMLPRNIIEILM